MKKKSIWLDNWQIKLLAVVTAVFLWLYIGITKKAYNRRPANSPLTEVFNDHGK